MAETEGRLHQAWAHRVVLPRLLRGIDDLLARNQGFEHWETLRADLQDELDTGGRVDRAFDNPELVVAMAMHLAADTVGQRPGAERCLRPGRWVPIVSSLLERAADLASAQPLPATALHDQVLDISARAMAITMDLPTSAAVGAALGRTGFRAIATAADPEDPLGQPTALATQRTVGRAFLRLRRFRDGGIPADDAAPHALAVALMDAVEAAHAGEPDVPELPVQEQAMLLSQLIDMGAGSEVALRARLLHTQITGRPRPERHDRLGLATSLEVVAPHGRHRPDEYTEAWDVIQPRNDRYATKGDVLSPLHNLQGTDPSRRIPELVHLARAFRERGDLPQAAAALAADPALLEVMAHRGADDGPGALRRRGGVSALEVRQLWGRVVAEALRQSPQVALEVIRQLPSDTASAGRDLRQALLETVADRAATDTTLPAQDRVRAFMSAVQSMQRADLRTGRFMVELAGTLARQPHGDGAVVAAARLLEQIGIRGTHPAAHGAHIG